MLSIPYLTITYTMLALPHGMNWLCMHESEHEDRCGLWHKSDWISATPPCHVVWDRYFNKDTLLWAIIIYTVASAEKSNDTSAVVRLLKHEIFRDLSTISLALYLGHSPSGWILKAITLSIDLSNFWHEYVLIMAVYVTCYVFHLTTVKISLQIFKWRIEGALAGGRGDGTQ